MSARSRTGWAREPARAVRTALGVAVLVGATACGAASAEVPVPTFPAAPSAPTTAPQAGPPDGLPADCEQLVGRDELPALFGLPVGSVAVRTVLGVPSPTIGRVQRTDCAYTVTDPAASPLGLALRMTVGRFEDPAAARDQHDRNVADQRAGASDARERALGGAAATFVRRGADSVLLTCYDTLTVDLDLGPRATPLPPEDLLTDLARRVLARLTSPRPDAHAP